MHSTVMLKLALLSLFSISRLTAAHSWVEQLAIIAPNGTMVGQPGFPRNFVQRSPTFEDSQMVFLIPPNGGEINKIDTDQMMCRPEQTTQTQSSDSPRLQASPGQSVALRYQENGHVTLPQNQQGKPEGSGANFVYYTTNSRADDKFLQIHRQWTADGNGGDGRGRLLSTQNFDDGQCYQINGGQISTQRQAQFEHVADATQGAALWCQQDIQIPTDAQPGSTVTLYWVWDWPTMPGTPGFAEGKQEIYTTCMDVDIVQPTGKSKAVAHGFVKQDFGKAAVAAQFEDIANPTAIKAQTIPFSGVAAASNTEAASSSTTSNTATTTQSPAVSNQTPDQVTVTIQETVTESVFETATPTGMLVDSYTLVPFRRSVLTLATASSSTPVMMTVETTDFVTVTKFRTVEDRRTSKWRFSIHTNRTSEALTATSVNAVASSNPTACSKTASAYQLRARNPFYILPSQDTPSSTGSSGC